MTYGGCDSKGVNWNTPGRKKGVIVTEQLESELVWLDAAHTKVGALVRGLGPGGRLEQNECDNGVHANVYGGILAEAQGDDGVASKSVRILADQGPLHLEGVGGTYREELFGSPENDEHAAKRWWEYQELLELCEEGGEPFPPGEKSQATCEAEIGEPNAVAPKPVMLEAFIESPSGNGVLPIVQTSVTVDEGEAFGVAEGPFAP